MAEMERLLERMEQASGVGAEEVRRILSAADAVLLSESPAHPTVRAALNLWQVRQSISRSRGNAIPGVDALVQTLESVVPHHKKLEQYAFSAGSDQGSIFFDYGTRRFLGYVLGSRKLIDLPSPETMLAQG